MKKVDFVFVDKRTDPSPGIPMYCPVCSFALRTYEDRVYYESKKCCYKCGLAFADSREEEWNSGWRPGPKALSEEVQKRLAIPVSVDLSLLRDT